MPRKGVGKLPALGLRQGRAHGPLQAGVYRADNLQRKPAATELAHGQRVLRVLRLRQGGHQRGRGRQRLPEGRPGVLVPAEQRTRFFLHRLNAVVRLVLLKTHRHQPVGQRPGRLAGGRLGQTGVGPVQLGDRPAAGKRHPQHPAQQLFNIGGAVNARDRAEHIGKGTVPALFERLDGDDVLNRTAPIKQVKAVEFALFAGRHRNRAGRDMLNPGQMRLQHPGRDFPALLLGLKQNDGPDVVGVTAGRLGQRGPPGNRRVDRVLPVVMLGQHDRQRDHVRSLQLLGGDAVQNV